MIIFKIFLEFACPILNASGYPQTSGNFKNLIVVLFLYFQILVYISSGRRYLESNKKIVFLTAPCPQNNKKIHSRTKLKMSRQKKRLT